MTERRVRPNGLVVGSAHPPIFHELLHRRAGGPWNLPVHAQEGSVARLARKIAVGESFSGMVKAAERFAEVVKPRYGEYGLSLYYADEGDDRL